MAEYDLVVRGGEVATGFGTTRCDIGIKGGRIVALAENLADGAQVLEAGGLLVLPGGIDSHCHIEEPSRGGYVGTAGDVPVTVNEESFVTASTSAFAGGTTSVVCFVPQWKGEGILPRIADYEQRAAKGMLDYSFHQIITDPTEDVLQREVPQIVAKGIRSLKVFLTYEPLHLSDEEYLKVLVTARKNGCLVTVHCENYAAIKWRTEALLAAGLTAPKYHAWSRPPVVEREATHRAIALAELVDQPIQVFHVSCAEAAEEIARAQHRGLKVWGETCPQYLTLTAADMDRPGFGGAAFMCSPSPRTTEEHARVWEMIRRGTLDVVTSDHCGFSMGGEDGKAVSGRDAPFRDIPNGIPGLAARLPILFSEGVSKGRITLDEFVRLTATNPARLMGLAPRKGMIAVGADADLALWDPKKQVTLTNALMQHAIDYTPYEGMQVTGWPVATVRRGAVVMRDGKVQAEPGTGQFLARGPYDYIRPRGVLENGFDAAPMP
ncbi:dihydropyrimidinase [Paracraurococcus ruber]|uniref:Dihydropyrimidinase n=1 Tax=Paracraurococcus ruber TaxID=77675 RepID=A0ABS1D0G1_9PROT|nr:dihydropyrimidinase [Paracraurococcus ruber]MBK1660293.1 dihydropyrimidinase [Paracraurococcus ruber]TDG29720.1 dihydropyrimidinase [Paracraurococcus ruber]